MALCKEAEVALELGAHANIVAIKFVAMGEPPLHESELFVYYDADAVEGRTLRQLMGARGDGPLYFEHCNSATELARSITDICFQISNAIRHMHRARIIHGDIKPENIVFKEDGHIVKLTDYGVSSICSTKKTASPSGTTAAAAAAAAARDRKEDDTSTATTLTCDFKGGTQAYRSPEIAALANRLRQCTSKEQYRSVIKQVPLTPATSDLWAFSLVILELFSRAGPLTCGEDGPSALGRFLSLASGVDNWGRPATREWILEVLTSPVLDADTTGAGGREAGANRNAAALQPLPRREAETVADAFSSAGITGDRLLTMGPMDLANVSAVFADSRPRRHQLIRRLRCEFRPVPITEPVIDMLRANLHLSPEARAQDAEEMHRTWRDAVQEFPGLQEELHKRLDEESDRCQLDDVTAANCWENMADFVSSNGLNTYALHLCRRGLTLREQSLGEEHPEVALSLLNFGSTLINHGQFDQAMEPLERGRWTLSKPEHRQRYAYERAVCLQNIGCVYFNQTKRAQALEFFTEALEEMERARGLNHADVADVLTYVGDALASLKREGEAVDKYSRAREIVSHSHGNEHPQYAELLEKLGRAQGRLGNPQLGLNLLQEALAIKRRLFGESNPAVASTEARIGSLEQDEANYSTALEHYQRALTVLRTSKGEHHREVLSLKYDIARVYKEMCQFEEALETLQEAIGTAQASYGALSLTCNQAKEELAHLYWKQERFEDALNTFTECLELMEKHVQSSSSASSSSSSSHSHNSSSSLSAAKAAPTSPTLSPLTLSHGNGNGPGMESSNGVGSSGPQEQAVLIPLLMAMSRLNARLVRNDTAWQLATRVKDIAYACSPPPSTQAVKALSFSSSVAYSTGKYATAYDMVLKTLEMQEEVLHTRRHILFAAELANAAEIFSGIGHMQEGFDCAQEALDIMVQMLHTNDHPYVADALRTLGNVEQRRGNVLSSRHAFDACHKIRKAVLGASHYEVWSVKHDLATVEHERGNFDFAIKSAQRCIGKWETLIGPHSYHISTARKILGCAYLESGRNEEAVHELDEAIDLRKRVLSTDAGYPFASLFIWKAIALAGAKRFHDAFRNLERGVESFRSHLGGEMGVHEMFAAVGFARVAFRAKKHRETHQYCTHFLQLRQHYQILNKDLAAYHIFRLLGEVRVEEGRFASAEEYFMTARSVLVQLNSQHDHLGALDQRIARVRQKMHGGSVSADGDSSNRAPPPPRTRGQFDKRRSDGGTAVSAAAPTGNSR